MAKRRLLHDFYMLMAFLKGDESHGHSPHSHIKLRYAKGTGATYPIPFTFGHVSGRYYSTAEDVYWRTSGRTPILAPGPGTGRIHWQSQFLEVVRPGLSR